MTQDDHRQIRQYMTLWSWLSAALVFLIVSLSALLLVYQDVSRRQAQHVSGSVDAISTLLRNVQQSLDRLNALDLPDCAISEDGGYGENLVAMHRELFLDDAIKDVGYFVDDRLACTTGRGLSGWARTMPPPDIVTDLGDSIWLRQWLMLFEGDEQNGRNEYTSIKRGNYNVMLDYQALLAPIVWPGQWQVLADYGDRQFTLAGSADLAELDSGVGMMSSAGIASSACGGRVGLHCVAVRDTYWSIIQYYGRFLPVLLATMLAGILGVQAVVRRRLKRRYSASARIARGLDRHAFRPVYQAMVDLRTGQNVGCEITARFSDEFGEIPRAEFIQIVRELGRTWELTEVVLRRGLDEMAEFNDWAQRFRVSFNIFPEDLESGDALKLNNLPGINHARHRYVMEVREDARLDTQAALDSLTALDTAGFWMAIDHFGTGYSNINMLVKAQCRWLKIDGSFVADIESQSLRSTLIPGIVTMAEARDIAIVALGVDNQLQIEALLEANVVWGQGKALGEAVDVKTLHAQTQRAVEHLIGQDNSEAPDHLV